MTIKVYVAGPLTTGDLAANITDAIDIADTLWGYGFIPFVPHLMTFYNIQCFHSYEEWMEYDFAWLKSCNALYRFPGRSDGADREVEKAQEWGRPVFYSVDHICAYFNKPPVS